MLMAVFCLGASFIGINAQEKDWASLQRYAQQNAELPKPEKNEKRVVFMGNSITEGWVNTHPDFFKNNGYIGRGIGGQTSYQFLVRFREDVINLSPALVVINAATNDIAENTGTYHEDFWQYRFDGGTGKSQPYKSDIDYHFAGCWLWLESVHQRCTTKDSLTQCTPESIRQSKQDSVCRLLFIDGKR